MGSLDGCRLEEAGMSREEARAFDQLPTTKAQISFLRRCRKDVLGRLHKEQKSLEKIDYLIFALQHGGEEDMR